jgi:hypothetical protein
MIPAGINTRLSPRNWKGRVAMWISLTAIMFEVMRTITNRATIMTKMPENLIA